MENTFSVQNFRGFKEKITFKLKPITIITGQNSSGKSSLLKSLQLLINSFNNGSIKSLRLWDTDLNLGSHETLANNPLDTRIIFNFNNLEFVYIKCEHFPEEAILSSITVYDENRNVMAIINGRGDIESFFLQVTYFVEELILRETQNNVNREILKLIKREDFKYFGDIECSKIDPNIYEYITYTQYFSFNITSKEQDSEEKIIPLLKHKELKEFLSDIYSPNEIRVFINEYNNSFYKILKCMIDAFQQLGKISASILLPSNRGLNKRLYNHQNSDNFLEKSIFDYFKYRKVEGDPIESEDGKTIVQDGNNFIPKWLKEFEIGTSLEINHISGVGLMAYIISETKKIHLSDLGYGISQLLPIILFSSYTYSNKVLIIEEPESHLHPCFQSKLAEMFVDAFQSSAKKFIIETHSEYLIRKLQFLVSKGLISNDDIAIYYFDKNKDAFSVREIIVRPDGILKNDFGTGFFDESVTLTKDLLTNLKSN